MKGNLIFSNLIIIRISTLRRRKKHLCTYIRAAEKSNVRFKMQKEAVPDGNCRRDWPEPRFAGDQTARTTRFLLFSSVIPSSCLSIFLSFYIYSSHSVVNYESLPRSRLSKLRSPFDESPSLSSSFSRKYLNFSILDRNDDY